MAVSGQDLGMVWLNEACPTQNEISLRILKMNPMDGLGGAMSPSDSQGRFN